MQRNKTALAPLYTVVQQHRYKIYHITIYGKVAYFIPDICIDHFWL